MCHKPARTSRKPGRKPGRKLGLQQGLQLARIMECGLKQISVSLALADNDRIFLRGGSKLGPEGGQGSWGTGPPNIGQAPHF